MQRSSRMAGGSYRRAHRRYYSPNCGPCTATLLTYATPGHVTVSQWSISELRGLVPRFQQAGLIPEQGAQGESDEGVPPAS